MKIVEFDVVFLSYDEPNAEKNYAEIKDYALAKAYFSENTISSGICDLVYLAPLPCLCFSNRFSKSLVEPVYKDPSTHLRI
jgi:hypothetical protein